MRIVIAGGHGQIARRLTRRLVQDGHHVTALIRNPEHTADVEQDGATAAVLDLEKTSPQALAEVLRGADVAVFAAGAGPGSGAARKDTVDRAASVVLADAAEAAGVRRFLQISSMGADSVREGARPEGVDDVFYAYLLAKLAAEEDLKARTGLDWTIVRPGGLTNDGPTGRVQLEPSVPRAGIPRADVAEVFAELIEQGTGTGQVLELVSGSTLVSDAVAALKK